MLKSRGILPLKHPLFLSLPSYHSVAWAREFCRTLKSDDPRALIVAGGRWVVGQQGNWIRAKIPEIDLVVAGTAEQQIVSLVDSRNWLGVPLVDTSLTAATNAVRDVLLDCDFRLVDEFQRFQPSIEVSRGCGSGCEFCVEGKIERSVTREPRNAAAQLRWIAEQYESNDVTPYFQASLFAPNSRWVREFEQEYASCRSPVLWRSQSRVDRMPIDLLGTLARCGLKVIDLGLESACERQLTAMRKTRNAQDYLRSASELLRECKSHGIWPKINLLLYAGENSDTVAETVDWMDRHRDFIKGVSVNPVVVYGHGTAGWSFLRRLCELGARPVLKNGLTQDGFARLHLSSEMDLLESQRVSLEVARRYTKARDYYDLKSFSYFPRGYSFEQFCSVVDKESSHDHLPFSVEEPQTARRLKPATSEAARAVT